MMTFVAKKEQQEQVAHLHNAKTKFAIVFTILML